MSTRSLIGKLNPNNTVDFIYCHFDGYPSGAGSTLNKHYTSPSEVDKLLALGDLRSLNIDIESSVAYGRDGNKPNTQAEVNMPLDIFLSMDYRGEDYKYLFGTNGHWECFMHDGTPVDLELKIEN